MTKIENKVSMFFGNLSIAKTKSFEVKFFVNDPTGKVILRIFESRTKGIH